MFRQKNNCSNLPEALVKLKAQQIKEDKLNKGIIILKDNHCQNLLEARKYLKLHPIEVFRWRFNQFFKKKELKPIIWFFWDFSSLKFIYSKIKPEIKTYSKKEPSTFFLWFLGIYFATFSISSSRYENRKDSLETRLAIIGTQLTTEARKGAFRSVIRTQNAEIPKKPEIWNPPTIIFSLIKDEIDADIIKETKELVMSLKDKLNNLDLSEINLEGADLYRANLKETDLVGANLQRAKLQRANLSGANLNFSYLSGAKLSTANLSETSLSGVDLSGQYLIETDLSGAKLEGVDLIKAKLIKAKLKGADLRLTDLSGANLSGANLSGANLSGANLSGANLSGANLSGANLSGANLFKINISNINELKLAENWEKASYTEAEFNWADIKWIPKEKKANDMEIQKIRNKLAKTKNK
ncbi:pentapeptide repeat-containing protein [Crocosphaera sp.]|uniref:pentapeptide repeat-containing protein n=1 Tax=Crocosphaera sp. TaxID=2729996 RepID=UPI00260B6187|nr:pentapeptide repeat-containing protein [Crocosphaera sp.]MDJ0579317.1 pentapeptide repeat-containing protein [Crocosphaera sp.]